MLGEHGGVGAVMHKLLASLLVNANCSADCLSLAGGCLKDLPAVIILTTLVNSANTLFCRSFPRTTALQKCAVRLDQPYLARLRLIITCWQCLFNVLERLLTILPNLLLYCHKELDGDALYPQLTNLAIIIDAYTLLPLFKILNNFFLACQVRGSLSGQLVQLLIVMTQQTTAMYITQETR